ncbi:hypothetical protein [Amycolatopsis thermophila]|uniref:Uncharacterized protein n=1 Tax=Amycolatopsis thermophila TaxID=206084 RepID=A0ABU0EMV5_9PSEU|nr:hypothetical protein [Amycolatopsis thermophila]MDQ0376602.1 hypothetical protein [Amycolatopsis thermophila]
MPYTRHGHWYGSGTPVTPRPRVARCGGSGLCRDCALDASGAAPAAPDRPCEHEVFQAEVAVNRLTKHEGGPVVGFRADVRVRCAQCGERFRWSGVPAGLLPDRPAVSVDGTELRAPLRPASADPDFGLGLPGFTVRPGGQG